MTTNQSTLQQFARTPTAWSLRAWPPLLWQATEPVPAHFQHLDTRIALPGDTACAAVGQTFWAASADTGDAGMAWDWVLITRGVVAMADPLAVVTNLRLVGREGEVLTALQAACFLNELVRALPWQREAAARARRAGALKRPRGFSRASVSVPRSRSGAPGPPCRR